MISPRSVKAREVLDGQPTILIKQGNENYNFGMHFAADFL